MYNFLSVIFETHPRNIIIIIIFFLLFVNVRKKQGNFNYTTIKWFLVIIFLKKTESYVFNFVSLFDYWLIFPFINGF